MKKSNENKCIMWHASRLLYRHVVVGSEDYYNLLQEGFKYSGPAFATTKDETDRLRGLHESCIKKLPANFFD
jgi:hypothetical protein